MASFDVSRPNTARIYDYWLGGKDNFEVDRAAAEAIRERRPDVADLALDNKKFLTRAVGYVAAQGIRQFIDIGSGLPTSPTWEKDASPLWLTTHEAAEAAVPDPVVAYVDNDPVAVLHSRVLLAQGSKRIIAVQGDLRTPGAVLADEGIRGAGFSLADPACVILGCVLHFVEPAIARQTVAEFAGAMAPGSYLIISVGYEGELPPDGDFTDAYNAQQGPRIYRQSRAGINSLFDGLDVVPPGIVDAAVWRPEWPQAPRTKRAAMILAGVARTA